VTLKSGLGVHQGHWTWTFDKVHGTSYWRYGSISYRFWDIQCRKM